jgi:DNA-binding GntR family transcriptional regulator
MTRPAGLGEAGPRPYNRLAARRRKQVLGGEIAPGDSVPSITTLAAELGYARQTCAKAMRLLEAEGVLIRVPGLGYYVTPQ